MNASSKQRTAPAAALMGANPRRPWVIATALAIITLGVYARTLGCGFIWFDDNEYVFTNARVMQGLTLENIRWAFTTFTLANWHPLTWLSHMLDAQIWGTQALGHHLTSVLLHVANALLLFWALLRMTGALWRSALVAALFALHPLHVESVAWISERKDMLSTFFGLLALFAYVRYVKQPTLVRYLFIVCAFALSLMCKPMLVTLPFVLLLLDWWPLKRLSPGDRANMTRCVAEKVPLLVIAIASSVITVIAQKSGGAVISIESIPLDQRLINAALAYTMYIWKTLRPADLAVFYPMRREIPMAFVIASVLTLAAITALVVARSQKQRALLVGWLWYLGTLVPVIGLVQVGFQSMADRYTYVPVIGIFIMVAWAIPELSARAARAFAAAWAIVIAAFAAGTWNQIGHWRDSYTLMKHAINVTDNNFIAHTILGYAYSRDGRMDDALAHYRVAVEMNPNYGVAHDNLGTALLSQQRVDEALHHLRQAARLQPRASTTRNNLGAALIDKGDMDAAIFELRSSIELDPSFAKARFNLGRALAARQDFSQAIEQYNIALQLQPDWPEALVQLGICQASLGELDQAISNFERALKSKPDHALAKECLAMAREQRAKQKSQ